MRMCRSSRGTEGSNCEPRVHGSALLSGVYDDDIPFNVIEKELGLSDRTVRREHHDALETLHDLLSQDTNVRAIRPAKPVESAKPAKRAEKSAKAEKAPSPKRPKAAKKPALRLVPSKKPTDDDD